ncbi:MAG: aspartate--tRNA ligase, partial [Acidobacteria bacterium]|nr:aspartate--tRNA ligase [Acidobacteriota bacterium]
MKLDFLGNLRRTHCCGDLRPAHAGQEAVLMGWVARARDLGSLIFIDLRDRTGISQVVFNRDRFPAAHQRAAELGREYVIAVRGQVVHRDPKTFNPELKTGEVELAAEEILVLNDARTPPFSIDDTAAVTEETRLRYRFLDLRSPRMQANIDLRHRIAAEIRRYMIEQGFFEIETPFMTRSTPEGARDYLVPSRVQPGCFYALPQSPQLFKQILMIAGFDRYFQIVRCFRDEDFRADRQAEFTQLDLEMSFPQQERVFEVVEPLLIRLAALAGVEVKPPFPRLKYDEAIRLYGSDKPDLRLPPLVRVNELFSAEELARLKFDPKLPLVAFRAPRCAGLSRKERDDLAQFIADRDARGFADLRLTESGLEGALAKNLPEAARRVAEAVGAQAGDLIPLVAAALGPEPHREEIPPVGPAVTPHDAHIFNAAGALRLHLGQKYNDLHQLLNPRDFRFLWVTDFPMFEWNKDEGRWMAAHHPFTSPHEQDMDRLESDPGAVRALAYDVVLNGTELGSGSIRIHRRDVQSKIFRALGFGEEEARARFGFFLEALEYGTPPHGGIALGLDRLVMILAGERSLREVIPFPKTARAVDLMVDAPTPVSEAQLRELGLAIRKP